MGLAAYQDARLLTEQIPIQVQVETVFTGAAGLTLQTAVLARLMFYQHQG
jgi:hypothetical protein